MRKRSLTVAAVPLLAGCALIATSAGASVHSKIYDFADLSVSVKALPSPDSAGRLLAFDINVKNDGPNDATGVTVTDGIPGGTSFVSATTPSGACAQSAGTVVCAIGSLQRNDNQTVRVVVQTPSAPGGVQTTARVSGDQTDFRDFNDRATVSVTLLGASTTQAGAFLTASGGSVTTGDKTTPSNPNATTVKVPATADGAAASITEIATTNPAKACGIGYTCHGQVIELNLAGGSFVTTKPVRLTMRLDASTLGGANPAKLPVFRNKALISKCKTAGIAKPAPCVESRTVLGGGDVKIVVLTVIDGNFRA